jgi:exopolyphosphatase / guanosine-5'-triphosphate,3'-diphosphate pyrophosphatase
MSEMVALIDLGSNAARFVLARLERHGGFTIVEQNRVQTRLGSGRDGFLCPRAVDQTVEATGRFLQRVRSSVDPRVLAIATAAVRDAQNRDLLVARLNRIRGVELRILSAEQEAELGVEAVMRERALPGDRVIADLGGGSLQVSFVRSGTPLWVRSLPLGVARMTRRFLLQDPPAPDELAALRREAAAAIGEALPEASHAAGLIVLGGSARALLRHCNRGLGVERQQLERERARLERLSLEARRTIASLDPQRADIIIAGAIVLEELMHRVGCRTLTASAASVRDALLWREAERHHALAGDSLVTNGLARTAHLSETRLSSGPLRV